MRSSEHFKASTASKGLRPYCQSNTWYLRILQDTVGEETAPNVSTVINMLEVQRYFANLHHKGSLNTVLMCLHFACTNIYLAVYTDIELEGR